MASPEQIKAVADLHQTFTDRDAEGFASHLADDAILRPSTLIAGREEYRGIDAVKSGFVEIGKILESTGEDVTVVPERFYADRADGDSVLTLAKLTVTRKDGAQVTTEIAYLWKFRGEKLTELHAWLDFDEGLKRLGDPEEVNPDD
jgi:ketosteroid isomerase-like protein